MKKIGLLFICLIVTYLIGTIGGIFADPGMQSSWYQEVKPEITPPNITFPIVWNVLFLLIGVSLWLVLRKADKHERRNALLAFEVNFAANILWSVFYFGMHNTLFAFIDSLVILISIIWMMAAAFKIDERASWLLVPYLLWVCFATVLTYMSWLKV